MSEIRFDSHSNPKTVASAGNGTVEPLERPLASQPPRPERMSNPELLQRFLIELRPGPRLAVRDFDSLEPLVELDEEAAKCLAAPNSNESDKRAAQLTESLRLLTGGTGGVRAREPQPSHEFRPQKTSRRKLWDLPLNLRCPVIGTCLDVDELRRLARKLRCQFEEPASDYSIHSSFVSSAGDRNPISVATQKALEKKFASHVRRFARAKTTGQLDELWRDALARGDVPGAFWATLTHAKCDDELRAEAFEAVHMLSHQIGAGQRADLKRLTEVEAELRDRQRDFDAVSKRSRQQLENREHRILQLEKSLTRAKEEHGRLVSFRHEQERQLAALRASGTPERIASLEQQARRYETQLQLAQRTGERWREACKAATHRASVLQAECQEKSLECAALERVLLDSLGSCQDCEVENCADRPDLQGQLLLCVGGRNQLIEQYRALVARCNGRFGHHDGGVEDNRQRLEAMLSSADAVVCTTDAVSHDAAYRVKRFCKRHAKRYVFLRSSGLSTFARALASVAH